jgi:hypothetical protein
MSRQVGLDCVPGAICLTVRQRVASLNHPGGKLTVVSFLIMQVEAKRLGLLHEFAPKADLIGVLLNANNPFFKNQSPKRLANSV